MVSGELKVRATVFGLCVLVGVVLVVPVNRSQADELNEPFSIINQNPFVRIFGLPRHRSSEVLGVGESESKIGYSVSSNYEFDVSNSENLIAIDGETETLTCLTGEALAMDGKRACPAADQAVWWLFRQDHNQMA